MPVERAIAARKAYSPVSGSLGEQGMTLVEVLTVLAIIAITASVTVLAIGSDNGLRGMAEAKQLEARLQLAADRVMISDTPMAIAVSSEGYSFLERDTRTGKWVATRDTALAGAFELPGDIVLRTDGAGTVFPLGAHVAGRPFSLVLDLDGRRWAIAFDGMTARLTAAEQDAALLGAVP